MDDQRAGQIMAQGHAWSEAVLLAVCQHYDIEVDDRIIPRIATGFAGGFGNTGAVCGAVVGAVMGLGLASERGASMEEAMGFLGEVAEFRRRFEAEMGSIHCGELTGADFSTMEGIEAYMASDTPQTVCFPAVNTAFRLVRDLVGEPA